MQFIIQLGYLPQTWLKLNDKSKVTDICKVKNGGRLVKAIKDM